MRIVEPTLAMFLSELSKEENIKLRLIQAAEQYLDYKKRLGQNDYSTREKRSTLEYYLMEYKTALSKIYDLMHDRGLTNFESGYVEPSKREKYFPFRPLVERDFDEDLQEFQQLMNINSLTKEGRHSKHTAHEGTDRAGTEGKRTPSFDCRHILQQSTPDIQSVGATASTNGMPGTQAVGSNSQQDADSDIYTEFVLP